MYLPSLCKSALTDNIEEELGIIKIKDKLCAPVLLQKIDDWKYLKNDYLTVLVVEVYMIHLN